MAMQSDETVDQQRRRDELLRYREFYDEAELDVSGRYDYWILTLSGSGLIASTALLYKMASVWLDDAVICLAVSCFCFLLSIILALMSLLTSQLAIREQREEIDRELRGEPPTGEQIYSRMTGALNWGSMSAFAFGAFLLVFAIGRKW